MIDVPLLGVAAAGAAIYITYRVARHQSAPTKGASNGHRTRGKMSQLPKRSLLVTAWNSSGASPVKSADLGGGAAELVGRATGKVARRSATRWSRRWKAVTSAAERSRSRRERRWQEHGCPPLMVRRTREPEPATVEPIAVVSPPRPGRPSTPGPDPPKRHLAAVPDPNPAGERMTATDTAASTLAAPDLPPDWALMIERVRNLNPEDDSALLAFMRGEALAVVAYAEALEQARDNCVNDIGLDPSAVAGFTDYSEHVSEAAQRMSEAYKTFVAVYGEVQKLAADGVALPHNGRWFTGAAG